MLINMCYNYEMNIVSIVWLYCICTQTMPDLHTGHDEGHTFQSIKWSASKSN